MLVGVNYPWIDYGWDFGDPPPAWVNTQHVAEWRERKREQIVTDFRACAEMGLFAVRWFILADGLSYGVGEAAPKKVGHLWAFDPLPGDHPFHWSAKATDEATTWTNADQLGAIGFINASANGDSNDE